MATIKKSTAPLLFLLFLLPYIAAAAELGRKVGGRTQVKNVKENKEIQDLGKYCVQEYNRQQKSQANGSTVPAAKLLVFSEVVEAETQVVSGIKYYLKISAATHGGGGVAAKTFDAVVVVKPWTHSKKLLNFEPSPSPKNTK